MSQLRLEGSLRLVNDDADMHQARSRRVNRLVTRLPAERSLGGVKGEDWVPHVVVRAVPVPTARCLTPTGDVRRANIESSVLSEQDARLILARRTEELLEGGPAARLSPERRERIAGLATKLGLRPFDASLIIAVVQDGARRQEGVADAPTQGRLAMVGHAGAPRENDRTWVVSLIVGMIVGAAVCSMLVKWIGG